MAETMREPERPLAPVRKALDRGHAAAVAALRHWRADVEDRIAQSEQRLWAHERNVQILETFLARVAALAGVEVEEPPNWNQVVGAVADLRDRAHQLEALAQTAALKSQEATQVLRRVDQQAVALAKIGARLGLATTDPVEILRAIDRLKNS